MKSLRVTLSISLAVLTCLGTIGMRSPSPLVSPGATIQVNTTLDEYDTTPNGTCSLREAIESANTDSPFGGCTGGSGADTILFQEGFHVYQLSIPEDLFGNSSGDLYITSELIIQGYGPDESIIDAGFQVVVPSRVFYISNPGDISVTIRGLTIQNGYATYHGGAIFSYAPLLLDNVVIQDCEVTGAASVGGGVYMNGDATLTLQGSTIRNNISSDSGGGIFSNGPLIINSSSILDNTAGSASGDNGGGVAVNAYTFITVSHSIFSGNSTYSHGGNLYLRVGTENTLIEDSIFRGGHARHGNGGNLYLYRDHDTPVHVTLQNVEVSDGDANGNGGGIANGVELDLKNVTLSGNHAGLLGGGLFTFGLYSDVDIFNSTIAYNSDDTVGQGDGIYSETAGLMDYYNSLFAYNGYAGPPSGHGTDCGGSFDYPPSRGYNLDRGDSCIITPDTGDLTFTNPALYALSLNHGFSRTHALHSTSPAVDAANNGTCQATDQRGWYRPVDGDHDGTATCDIGAFEYGHVLFFLPMLARP